jgi:6-phosphogluconolactonase
LDKIFGYRLDSALAAITANEPPFVTVPPGSGPRHFAFHPKGKFAYSVNEMKSSVTAFAYDKKKGALTNLQTMANLPQDFTASAMPPKLTSIRPENTFTHPTAATTASQSIRSTRAGERSHWSSAFPRKERHRAVSRSIPLAVT